MLKIRTSRFLRKPSYQKKNAVSASGYALFTSGSGIILTKAQSLNPLNHLCNALSAL
jgi:hypothetical protein